MKKFAASGALLCAYRFGIAMLVVFLTGSCANPPPAPVEERNTVAGRSASTAPAPAVYTVRRGDTLYAIAFRFGLDFRDIASWNQLRSADQIATGQHLRLRPAPQPQKRTSTKTTTKKITKRARNDPPPAKPIPKSDTGNKTENPANWQWPTRGKLLATFETGNPARTGLDISGREGQAISAAADGTVVYSGSGLIGYGELIIIKHNDRLLSAYAHNRKRLVRERDLVKSGQQIAEMGRNGSNQIMLHFEIRINGSPVDPRRFLSSR